LGNLNQFGNPAMWCPLFGGGQVMVEFLREV